MNKNKSSKSQKSWLELREERTNVAARRKTIWEIWACFGALWAPGEEQSTVRWGTERPQASGSPRLPASLRSLCLRSAYSTLSLINHHVNHCICLLKGSCNSGLADGAAWIHPPTSTVPTETEKTHILIGLRPGLVTTEGVSQLNDRAWSGLMLH